MKSIIVGIDFSTSSFNVLKHAIAVAIRYNADIHLVWVKTPGITKNLPLKDVESFSHTAEAKLDELVYNTQKEAPNCIVQKVILEGKAAVEITKYANNLTDAFLAIGAHGNSGYEEKYVGSNALRIVSMSNIPVLMIREGINIGRDLTEILVPIDSSFETLQKLKYAISFAKAFNAKLNIIGMYTSTLNEAKQVVNIQLNHVKHMCENANIRFDINTVHTYENAEKTLVEYAKSADINLIVIMREEEEEFSDFWLGNTTCRLLNNTPMPLLIIPNVNHFDITK